MRRPHQFLPALCLLLGFAFPIHAQRPTLFTENPLTVGNGQLEVGVGIEYLKKTKAVPPRAPKSLWKISTFRSYFGVGDIVDVVLDWRGRILAKQQTGRHVSDWGDLSIGTKINFLKEAKSHPSLGVMYLVKLPNTSHDELLGSNATDFFLSVLASKQFSEIELRANLGLGILDDPDQPHSQLDIYTMGIVCIFPIGKQQHLFVECAGFLGSHSDQAKFVARYGFESKIAELQWSLFGSLRVIGDEKDFGTAFEYSESWAVGLFVKTNFHIW